MVVSRPWESRNILVWGLDRPYKQDPAGWCDKGGEQVLPEVWTELINSAPYWWTSQSLRLTHVHTREWLKRKYLNPINKTIKENYIIPPVSSTLNIKAGLTEDASVLSIANFILCRYIFLFQVILYCNSDPQNIDIKKLHSFLLSLFHVSSDFLVFGHNWLSL